MQQVTSEFLQRVEAEGLDGLGEMFMVITRGSGRKHRAKVESVTALQMADHAFVDVLSENVIDIVREDISLITHIQVHSATMEALLYEKEVSLKIPSNLPRAYISLPLVLY